VPEYDVRLINNHKTQIKHDLPNLTTDMTLMDAISMVFYNDAGIMASFLQAYIDGMGHAREVVNDIIAGLDTGTLCLHCMAMSIKK
jgi:hypothetical protein